MGLYEAVAQILVRRVLYWDVIYEVQLYNKFLSMFNSYVLNYFKYIQSHFSFPSRYWNLEDKRKKIKSGSVWHLYAATNATYKACLHWNRITVLPLLCPFSGRVAVVVCWYVAGLPEGSWSEGDFECGTKCLLLKSWPFLKQLKQIVSLRRRFSNGN